MNAPTFTKTRPAIWSPEQAYADLSARLDAEFPATDNAWRPLSEDARGFGPAELQGGR